MFPVLNEQLRFLRSNVTVVAFFITPAPARSFTVEALKGQAVTKQLRDTVSEITQEIGRRIFDETVRSGRPRHHRRARWVVSPVR